MFYIIKIAVTHDSSCIFQNPLVTYSKQEIEIVKPVSHVAVNSLVWLRSSSPVVNLVLIETA